MTHQPDLEATLTPHAERLRQQPVSDLFAADPERFSHFSREADGLLFDFSRQRLDKAALDALIELADACLRVLRLPAVADKSFLIHIGDRTVGGLVARDQLVGPWQVPVSDVGVTALGFETFVGVTVQVGASVFIGIRGQ